jgi:hypothetical protein
MATQAEVARRARIDIPSVNKNLNHRHGAFRKETVKRVFKVARELRYDFDRLKHNHRRERPRKDVIVPVEMTVYLATGRLYTRGKAVLRNVSLSGAVLSGFVLQNRSVPLEPHTIGVKLLDGPLKGLEILGSPVRLTRNPAGFGLAIEFMRSQSADLRLLAKIA